MIVLLILKVKRFYTAYITFVEIKYQLAIFFMKVHMKSIIKKLTNVSFISAPDKT